MSPSKCSISIACRVQSPLPDAHTHGHRKIVPWRPFDQWSATTALNLVVEPMVCHLCVQQHAWANYDPVPGTSHPGSPQTARLCSASFSARLRIRRVAMPAL